MISKLKKVYKEMKKEYLGVLSQNIPEQYWSTFVCVGAASDMQYSLGKIIGPEKKRILIVGLFGGRDYFYLKSKGHEVHGLDLFQNSDFENVKIGNMEEKFPFPERYFDYIIIAGVLEHVPRDYESLLNVRNSLKEDGKFILRIPFYNDIEVSHVNIYNYKSVVRLLNMAGFEVDQHFFYPNLFLYPPVVNYANHAVNFTSFALSRKTLYRYTLPVLWKLEYALSKINILPLREVIWKLFPNKGEGLFACGKTKNLDYISLNLGRWQE